MSFLPQIKLEVHMTDKVISFIKEKGGNLTLEEAPPTGCCSHHIFVGAQLGKPEDQERFLTYQQEGIMIYYDPYVIKDDRKYEIDLEGFLGWKTIVVY